MKISRSVFSYWIIGRNVVDQSHVPLVRGLVFKTQKVEDVPFCVASGDGLRPNDSFFHFGSGTVVG
jgi:hypothetical protein